MKLIRGFDPDAGYRGGIISIGNFDGVHRGHQRMLAALVEEARKSSVPAVVLTFDPHPLRLLRPAEAPPALTTLSTKAELLERCGVDIAVVLPTSRDLLALSPGEFFRRVLLAEFEARGLVEGPNFCFGKNRAGTIETLQQLCEEHGLSLKIVPPLTRDGRLVSSSEIRHAIAAGEMRTAVEMLGHPYRLRGTVVRGAGRGESLGFPTANLEGVETLLPADGVYAGTVELDGRTYPAAIHLGKNPTFDDNRRKVEVHLIDYSGDLYGRELAVDLRERLRGVTEFPSTEALRQQLEKDIQQARRSKRFP